jgi:TRAP-type C4-dicarboxylate transport system substrate-binding protein
MSVGLEERMGVMKRAALSILAVAAALAGLAGQASAQTVLRVANWLPPKHPLIAEIITPWTEQVKEATKGRVVMQVLPSPLGPPPAHFDFAVNGVADVTYGVHNYTPGRFVATMLAELPFWSDKSETLSVAYWRVHQKYLDKANEHKGTKLLGVFTHGPGHLWTKGRNLKDMASIKGSKIRIGGGFAQEAAKALQLVPIQAPVTQAFEILSGGVADGIQFPAESVTAFKIDPVLDQGLIVPGGLYNVSFFVVMNEAKWKALPADDQAAILSVSGEKLAKLAGQIWDKADAGSYRIMAEKGKMTLVRPDGAQLSAMKAALAPYVETAMKQIGARDIDARAAYDALKAEIKAVEAGK